MKRFTAAMLAAIAVLLGALVVATAGASAAPVPTTSGKVEASTIQIVAKSPVTRLRYNPRTGRWTYLSGPVDSALPASSVTGAQLEPETGRIRACIVAIVISASICNNTAVEDNPVMKGPWSQVTQHLEGLGDDERKAGTVKEPEEQKIEEVLKGEEGELHKSDFAVSSEDSTFETVTTDEGGDVIDDLVIDAIGFFL